jgi:hypothetical protein
MSKKINIFKKEIIIQKSNKSTQLNKQ